MTELHDLEMARNVTEKLVIRKSQYPFKCRKFVPSKRLVDSSTPTAFYIEHLFRKTFGAMQARALRVPKRFIHVPRHFHRKVD